MQPRRDERWRYYDDRRPGLGEGQASCKTNPEVALRTYRLALFSMLAIGLIASMTFGQRAHAQAGACDRLKIALAARIDPSIPSYTLEAVAVSAPVPAGAKVIGTCEGGARKILFLRSGNAQTSSDTASTVASVSAPQASAAPDKTNRPLVQVQSNFAPTPATASASIVNPQHGPPAGAAVAAPQKRGDQALHLGASAGTAEAAHVDERSAVQRTEAHRDIASAAGASIAFGFSEFMGRHWYWLAALALLMLVGLLWPWLAHRRVYDATGLPRGPKIRSPEL